MRYGVSRRRFLAGLGAAAVAAPWLPALVGRADAARFPKRFVIFWTPNGVFDPEWVPSETFGLGRALMPCADFADRMLVFNDLDWTCVEADPAQVSNDHQPMLSYSLCATNVVDHDPRGDRQDIAVGGGPSIDQFIADKIAASSGAPAHRSLVAMVNQSGAGRDGISYRAAREPVRPIADPLVVWDRFFADGVGGEDEMDRLRAERKSALDVVGAELRAFRNRVGDHDRDRIDAHLDRFRALEQRLTQDLGGGACIPPERVDGTYTFPEQGARHMDLVTAALACDLTRVALIQWDGARTTHRWAGVEKSHHDLSHFLYRGRDGYSDADIDEELARIAAWYGEQFASFLRRLDAVPEGDGTMLDNTVVLWTSEHRGSAVSQGTPHHRGSVPFLLAGGGIRGGRRIDCGGRAHNDLYISIAHLMGFDDVGAFGNPDVCRGPIEGLV